MIKKYKQFNEGIKSLLVGPDKDEISNNLKTKYNNGEIDLIKYYEKCKEYNLKGGPSDEEALMNYNQHYNKGNITFLVYLSKCKKYNLKGGPTDEEIWKYFGYDKTFNTPEEFFSYVVDGLVGKPLSNYPDTIHYEKNNITYFEYLTQNRWLYVNQDKIMDIFKYIFYLSQEDTKNFIKEQWKKYLQLSDNFEIFPISRIFRNI